MAKDERIFRVVKKHYSGRTTVLYKSRTAISAMFAGGLTGNRERPDILKVEAIDPADIEWDDVTDEFRNKPEPKCCYHPAYTGVRKPRIWGWPTGQRYYTGCKCTDVYLAQHPDYPAHDPLCSLRHTDPASCSCQMLKKILE